MTLTLEIAPEVEAALKEKAKRRGMAVDAYLLDLAARDESGTPPQLKAAQVRGKYAIAGAATVDDFMAERRAEGLAEGLAEEAAYQAQQAKQQTPANQRRGA